MEGIKITFSNDFSRVFSRWTPTGVAHQPSSHEERPRSKCLYWTRKSWTLASTTSAFQNGTHAKFRCRIAIRVSGCLSRWRFGVGMQQVGHVEIEAWWMHHDIESVSVQCTWKRCLFPSFPSVSLDPVDSDTQPLMSRVFRSRNTSCRGAALRKLWGPWRWSPDASAVGWWPRRFVPSRRMPCS